MQKVTGLCPMALLTYLKYPQKTYLKILQIFSQVYMFMCWHKFNSPCSNFKNQQTPCISKFISRLFYGVSYKKLLIV